MLIYPASLAILLSSLLAVQAARGPKCVGTGDETEINRLLDNGGKGTKVHLCPNAMFRLQNPIVFTSEDQELSTLGYPLDDSRAMLIVEGQNQSMAIKADCSTCHGAKVSSVIIDGNRPLLLRVPKGDALIEMGNANGQKVEGCKLYEPRGWSAVHFREGDWKSCSKGQVLNNEIGPCGEEWDFDYDGYIEKSPNFGNPRSDGISLACMDSLVEGNTVFDTTDGAIVLFGSMGSIVRNNKIYSRTRTVLGGINLVDVPPWEGDYTSVLVTENKVAAFGAFLKVGINVGPAVWSDDTESLVGHGTIIKNEISGGFMGYGIVVASCKNFTVMDNYLGEGAKFTGVMDDTVCPTAPRNAEPIAFLINKGSSDGVFQKEFVNGEVQHIICIDPKPKPGDDGLPRRLRDSPLSIKIRKEQAAAEGGGQEVIDPFKTIDPMVADALVGYQAAIIKNVGSLGMKVDDLIIDKPERRGKKQNLPPKRSPFTAALADLSTRLANLESDRRQLRATFEGLRVEMKGFNKKFEGYNKDRTGLLKSLLKSAREISSLPKQQPPMRKPVAVPPTLEDLYDEEEDIDDDAYSVSDAESWTPFVMFVTLQAFILMGWYVVRSELARRKLNRKSGKFS